MATSEGKAASGDAARGPDRSLLRVPEGRAQAHGQGVQGGQAHRLGCGPDRTYGVLAIFPALLVVVSVLGLMGDSVTDKLLTNLEDVAPGPAQESTHERDHQPAGRGQRIGSCLRHRSWGRGLGVLGLT